MNHCRLTRKNWKRSPSRFTNWQARFITYVARITQLINNIRVGNERLSSTGNIILSQLSHLDSNQTILEENLTDDNYMLVDDLQKLTDEYVTEVNSTLTPKQLWRPYIELVFKDIDAIDLDKTDKVLVGDLEYLKEVALMLALTEEEELGKEKFWISIIFWNR